MTGQERAADFGGALWRRPWLKARLAPRAAGRLAFVVGLHRRARRAVRLVVLDGRLVHGPARPRLDDRQLPARSGTSRRYRTVALRTIAIAAAVTIADAVIAFPFAYFMARVAGPRTRAVLFVLVLLPLWASYLARVYCVAADPQLRRPAQLVAATSSGCRTRTSRTRTRRSGSCSPTSGCRS